MTGNAMNAGGKREEVGGVIHAPISGFKYMFMFVVACLCLLAIWFSILDRFEHRLLLGSFLTCWTYNLVRLTLDAPCGSVQHLYCL